MFLDLTAIQNNMNIDLTKEDLAALVKGIVPYYSLFEDPLVKKSGHFNGGFSSEWSWNYGFEKNLTEQELWDLYIMCRDSWIHKDA